MHGKRKKKEYKPLTFTYKNLLHGKSTYFYKQKRFSSCLIPTGCIVGLLLALGMMINPTIYNSSDRGYALEGDEAVDMKAETAKKDEDTIVLGDTGNNAKAATSLSITWITNANLERETNAGEGGRRYRYDLFSLSASNIKQYQIFVNAASGSGNKLVGYLDADHTIPLGVEIDGVSSASGVLGSNIPANQWGYAIGEGYKISSNSLQNLTYKAVPSSGSTTAAFTGTEETINEKVFTLAFGVNMGSDKPSGHYVAYVVMSAVMEPKTWDDMVYMQDMTPALCASETTPAADDTTVPTKMLTDNRDGSTYTIAKLKDGNCWMTQNLRLVGNRTLTAEDSDVSVEFDLPMSAVMDSATDDPKQFSRSDRYQSKVYYRGSINNGAYYNWYAATAGTGDASFTSGNAPSSICPKGWRLPISSRLDDEFYNLLNGLTVAEIMAEPYSYMKGGWVAESIFMPNLNYYPVGNYWSSGYSGDSTARVLYFWRNDIEFGRFVSVSFGHSVRCVAR